MLHTHLCGLLIKHFLHSHKIAISHLWYSHKELCSGNLINSDKEKLCKGKLGPVPTASRKWPHVSTAKSKKQRRNLKGRLGSHSFVRLVCFSSVVIKTRIKSSLGVGPAMDWWPSASWDRLDGWMVTQTGFKAFINSESTGFMYLYSKPYIFLLVMLDVPHQEPSDGQIAVVSVSISIHLCIISEGTLSLYVASFSHLCESSDCFCCLLLFSGFVFRP